MSARVDVRVGLLRRASEVLLDHLNGVEGEVVSLDRDYFWAIAQEQLYDPYHEPSGFTVGQVSECIENLERIVADPSKSTAYALVWLADVLRGIGHAVAP